MLSSHIGLAHPCQRLGNSENCPVINSCQIQKIWFSKSSFTGSPPPLGYNAFVVSSCCCSEGKRYHLKILSVLSDVRCPPGAGLVSTFLLGQLALSVGLSPFAGTRARRHFQGPSLCDASCLSGPLPWSCSESRLPMVSVRKGC